VRNRIFGGIGVFGAADFLVSKLISGQLVGAQAPMPVANSRASSSPSSSWSWPILSHQGRFQIDHGRIATACWPNKALEAAGARRLRMNLSSGAAA